MYLANRLLKLSFKADQLEHFETGKLHLDALTRIYIHTCFEYQYACVDTSAEAYALELRSPDGGVFGVKPLLNPAQA